MVEAVVIDQRGSTCREGRKSWDLSTKLVGMLPHVHDIFTAGGVEPQCVGLTKTILGGGQLARLKGRVKKRPIPLKKRIIRLKKRPKNMSRSSSAEELTARL